MRLQKSFCLNVPYPLGWKFPQRPRRPRRFDAILTFKFKYVVPTFEFLKKIHITCIFLCIILFDFQYKKKVQQGFLRNKAVCKISRIHSNVFYHSMFTLFTCKNDFCIQFWFFFLLLLGKCWYVQCTQKSPVNLNKGSAKMAKCQN